MADRLLRRDQYEEAPSLDIGTLPYWIDSASFPTFAKIDRDVDVDVVVVGGGITGLTTAYLLTSAGKSVALIERGRCAEIDTAHTTAHLTMVTDTRLNELVGRFGRSHAQAVWDAGRAAIDQIERIVDEHGIDCSFDGVEGYLHAPAGELDAEQVDSLKEDANLARELGFGAEFVDDVPLMGGPGALCRSGSIPPAQISRRPGARDPREGRRDLRAQPCGRVSCRPAQSRSQWPTAEMQGHRDRHTQSDCRRSEHNARGSLSNEAGALHELRRGRTCDP